MNKFVNISTFLITICVAFGVNAEQKASDNIDITGTWKLEAARPTLEKVKQDNRNKRLEDTPYKYLAVEDNKKNSEVWVFKKSGDFELTFDDPRTKGKTTSKTTYSVEGDSLKIAKLGRPGKFYRYKIISREANKLTLKGGLEGYYFFSK
jgi:Lipocalin-like domain